MILYLCALHRKGLTPPEPNARAETAIKCVYIQAPHPFQEVEDFVEVSVKTYSLQLLEYAKPMKAAFADYLHDTPSVKAIFVGTRRTDPHGEHLKHFDPTDSGWPPFMRIHPVIDWHYVDIWTVSSEALNRAVTLVLTGVVHSSFKHSVLQIVRLRVYLARWNRRHASQPRAREAESKRRRGEHAEWDFNTPF